MVNGIRLVVDVRLTLISYCSSACQKKDWLVAHKHICKRLKRVNAMPREPGTLTWRDYQRLQVCTIKFSCSSDL